MTQIIDGNEIGDRIKNELAASVEMLADSGVTPGLAPVLMSNDGASETYVSMKQQACEEVVIEGYHHEIDPDESVDVLFDRIDELNEDPSVHGILVQMPVPDHINKQAILRRIDPIKDIDRFHPENVGRLVAGNPRFKPCTPHGIQKLLVAVDVNPEGKDVVIVGRSNIVGKPLSNLLLQKSKGGKATVTVCHSRTDNMAAKTRKADVVVAAAGVPELIDEDMITQGTTILDVGVNRIEAATRRATNSSATSPSRARRRRPVRLRLSQAVSVQ